MFSTIEEVNGEIVDNHWVEWDHFGVPNQPKEYRDAVRSVLVLLGHCLKCTVLDGCYFVARSMPEMPLHQNCDCSKFEISKDKVVKNATAECPIEKFTEYIFTDIEKSKGKITIFESLGFSKNDASFLKQELEEQCLKNYLQGNYKLKDLDINGQRVAIPVTLSGENFYAGWLLLPDGKIINTTPFGAWIK